MNALHDVPNVVPGRLKYVVVLNALDLLHAPVSCNQDFVLPKTVQTEARVGLGQPCTVFGWNLRTQRLRVEVIRICRAAFIAKPAIWSVKALGMVKVVRIEDISIQPKPKVVVIGGLLHCVFLPEPFQLRFGFFVLPERVERCVISFVQTLKCEAKAH